MVRSPLDYEYSSYGLFAGGNEKHKDEDKDQRIGKSTKVAEMIKELVETDRVLQCFTNNPREQYRMFVEGKISHAEQELLIQKNMKEDDMWLPW